LTVLFTGSRKASKAIEPASSDQGWYELPPRIVGFPDDIFEHSEQNAEQDILDAILEAVILEEEDKERIRSDPLVRLLIPNPPVKYNFIIVSAAGVVTEGKKGEELKDAFDR